MLSSSHSQTRVPRQVALKAKIRAGIASPSAATSMNEMFMPADPASVAVHVTLAGVLI
jgi:hypothetical protein